MSLNKQIYFRKNRNEKKAKKNIIIEIKLIQFNPITFNKLK